MGYTNSDTIRDTITTRSLGRYMVNLLPKQQMVHSRINSAFMYYHLAGITFLCTYAVMLLGSYTGAIGAGLSCLDWPKCYGTWIPFFHPEIILNSPYSGWQIFAEWAHRGFALIDGILILGTVATAWRYQRNRSIVLWSATLVVVLLPVQILLGGLTVTQRLQPIVVTSHLGTATLILVALATTTLASFLQERMER